MHLQVALVFADKHSLNVGFPGGFSDTYAALCDLNEMPFREEIQWVSKCNATLYHATSANNLGPAILPFENL